MILVDTSVLVDFLRGRPTEGAESLRRLEQDGVPFAIPAICCQELLAGARDEDEWRLLLTYLETQDVDAGEGIQIRSGDRGRGRSR